MAKRAVTPSGTLTGTIVLGIDPGKSAGFSLIDGAGFVPGTFRGALAHAPILASTQDLSIAAKWHADVVVCEQQYSGGICRGRALLTLAWGAGALGGFLFETSGAEILCGMTPHAWKETLCPGGGTIRKEIFSARLARAIGSNEHVSPEDFDQLDSIGIAWAWLASDCTARAKSIELQRTPKGIRR